MKSSYSGQNGCVDVEHELAFDDKPDAFVVTDTKAKGEGPKLKFNRQEWDAFLLGAKAGEFDLL